VKNQVNSGVEKGEQIDALQLLQVRLECEGYINQKIWF
jgi:hypothetical protein